MEKVIFSKFSNERKSQYGIITKIVESDGRRRVLKEALSQEATRHIKKIEQNMVMLNQYYCDENLVIVPCYRIDEKTVEFEYIKARRYDDVIEELIDKEKYGELEKELKKLKAIITNVKKLENFQLSNQFVQVFGEYDYTSLKEKKAFSISNIDMIFGNLFIKKEKLFVTDYEWVFDFQVPVEYVLFRSLLLCSAISKLDKIKKEKLYECLGIELEEIDIYEQMEDGLQKFVSGENFFEDYKKSAKNKIFQLEYAEELLTDKYIDIYYKLSNERDIFVQRQQYIGTDIDLEHKIKNMAAKIIFYLGSTGALVKVKEIKGFYNEQLIENICVKTNADLIIEDDYYFKDKIPYFEITNMGYEKIFLSVSVIYENTGLIGIYTDKIVQNANIEKRLIESEREIILKNGDIKFCNEMIEEQNKVIQQQKEQMEVLNTELQETRNRLQEIQSSSVWKIYKKMKHIKEKVVK